MIASDRSRLRRLFAEEFSASEIPDISCVERPTDRGWPRADPLSSCCIFGLGEGAHFQFPGVAEQPARAPQVLPQRNKQRLRAADGPPIRDVPLYLFDS